MKTALGFLLALLCVVAVAVPQRAHGQVPAAAPTHTPCPANALALSCATPEQVVIMIRTQFRSHRPPPPYVTYTLVRSQTLDDGFPDLVDSYTYHIWCRTLDRAALGRKVYRGSSRGYFEFLRPSFNEPWDPGPPTADLFEPAPVHPHNNPRDFVPTPEPTTNLQVIATVVSIGLFDYRVTAVAHEGDQIHVSLQPQRDPDRNRLRELYVDAKTLELQKVIATDKLFEEDSKHVYPMLFTVTLQMLDGRPVVTQIHGTPTLEKDAEYLGKDATVDYDFKDIQFPASLPDWYFDPKDYGAHQNDDDAPE